RHPPAPPVRPGVVELPAQRLRAGRRRAADQLRHEPAAEPGRRRGLHRHARRRRAGRPGPGHRPDGLRASGLHPGLGRGAAPAAWAEHPRHRLCRGLPRLGVPRGRLPVRRGSGPVPRGYLVSALYEVTISHARSAPLRNVFRYRGYLWLVDLDRLPRIPLLTVFRGRDHLGDPRRGIRENLDRFLAANGISRRHTITMLTQARVLGYVFNPLTVYWCHRPDCVVAEVHNTYGQRYAYLLHPDARGRA